MDQCGHLQRAPADWTLTCPRASNALHRITLTAPDATSNRTLTQLASPAHLMRAGKRQLFWTAVGRAPLLTRLRTTRVIAHRTQCGNVTTRRKLCHRLSEDQSKIACLLIYQNCQTARGMAYDLLFPAQPINRRPMEKDYEPLLHLALQSSSRDNNSYRSATDYRLHYPLLGVTAISQEKHISVLSSSYASQ